jgi:hypothetical protein
MTALQPMPETYDFGNSNYVKIQLTQMAVALFYVKTREMLGPLIISVSISPRESFLKVSADDKTIVCDKKPAWCWSSVKDG